MSLFEEQFFFLSTCCCIKQRITQQCENLKNSEMLSRPVSQGHPGGLDARYVLMFSKNVNLLGSFKFPLLLREGGGGRDATLKIPTHCTVAAEVFKLCYLGLLSEPKMCCRETDRAPESQGMLNTCQTCLV